MTMFASPIEPRAGRPLRAGLFQLDPPRLLGSRCPECSTVTYPSKDFCPACHCEAEQAPVALSSHGVVFSYTVVHQAPAGRRTPYVLAYVDLPDGVRVMAQIDHPPAAMRLGLPVTLDIRQVGEDADGPVIGYVFIADEAGKEAA
jgi:uncharacterized OB-fold protein